MTEKKEVQLTDREHHRLTELMDSIAKGEEGMKQFGILVQELSGGLRELRGRQAELLETLAEKYEFTPNVPYTLGEGRKLILEG